MKRLFHRIKLLWWTYFPPAINANDRLHYIIDKDPKFQFKPGQKVRKGPVIQPRLPLLGEDRTKYNAEYYQFYGRKSPYDT